MIPDLTIDETEEIITSLVFSNYIRNDVKLSDETFLLLNKILKFAYQNGYTKIVKCVDDKYLISDSAFEKIVSLAAKVGGEKIDDIQNTTKELLNEVRKTNLN